MKGDNQTQLIVDSIVSFGAVQSKTSKLDHLQDD